MFWCSYEFVKCPKVVLCMCTWLGLSLQDASLLTTVNCKDEAFVSSKGNVYILIAWSMIAILLLKVDGCHFSCLLLIYACVLKLY